MIRHLIFTLGMLLGCCLLVGCGEPGARPVTAALPAGAHEDAPPATEEVASAPLEPSEFADSAQAPAENALLLPAGGEPGEPRDLAHEPAPPVELPEAGAAEAPARLADNRAVPSETPGTDSLAVQTAGVEEPGYRAKPKADPIAINGKYFEGWPKPRLALAFSGRQDGYLEPCGCAGLDQQKGGMSRRHSFLQSMEQQGWPVVALDVGGLVGRFGRQAELKFGISAEALKKMNYRAVGFGPQDLRLSAGEIVAAVAGASPEDSIFVSANVSLFDLTPKVRVIEAGGLKIGITSVLGKEYQQQVNNDEIVITPADEALRAVVGQLAGCNVRVLLAHATVEESRSLAKQFPQFQMVVTSDGRDVPPLEPEELNGGKTHLLEIAPKSMYMIVAGLYDDPSQPLRFQRVALDSRFPDSRPMKDLMANYQDQLRQLGWKELGIKPVSHPRANDKDPLAGQFAGAENCRECHPTAFGIWSKSKHAQATESLAKLDPPRQFDAECVSCHATGWNPQEYTPFVSGFDGLDTTPLLSGNQCENCHGPSAAHVAAEQGRNRTKKEEQRQVVKLTVGQAFENVCVKCHDHDNSPEFNEQSFEAHYWPKVQHKGKR